MSQFADDIKKFNAMYGMPVASAPVGANSLVQNQTLIQRLTNFKAILAKELDEIDDIFKLMADGAPHIEVLTALADLLGDVQVYCASEMAKWGLPLDVVLATIMQSNFSKMGADGKPIYDEQGKLQKGPGYWQPEPKLQAALEGRIQAAELMSKGA